MSKYTDEQWKAIMASAAEFEKKGYTGGDDFSTETFGLKTGDARSTSKTSVKEPVAKEVLALHQAGTGKTADHGSLVGKR